MTMSIYFKCIWKKSYNRSGFIILKHLPWFKNCCGLLNVFFLLCGYKHVVRYLNNSLHQNSVYRYFERELLTQEFCVTCRHKTYFIFHPELQYSQRHSMLNHCDRHITLLSDTDISFGLFNPFIYSDMPFGW
jgi:hypothetical protein